MRRALLALVLTALPSAALADGLDRALGKALFERNWVAAPASTDAADGLGPLFAERSCASCHSGPAEAARIVTQADGSARVRGFVLRLGDGHGAIDPVYGRQVQPRAVHGLQSEGRLDLSATEAGPIAVRFEPARGPLAAATRASLRQAPSILTARAIAAVDEDAIRARADPDDADGDGISGRVREVDGRVGRFGWKAAFPHLDDQIADAFAFDMGLSTPHVPLPHGDCTAAEPDCLAAPTGRSAAFDGEEISAEMLRLVAAYVGNLKPKPAAEPDGMGEALFAQVGCGACHVPAMPAKDGAVLLYSDLLLHHLGGALDDGVGEPGAASSEWRTAPLLALSARLAGGGRLLHDGRAATVDAAIRAHGGEAEAARSRYHGLSAAERAALTRFVEGL